MLWPYRLSGDGSARAILVALDDDDDDAFATTHGATADARLCLPSGRVKELVAVTSQTTPTPRGGSGLDLAVNRRVFGNVNVTVNVDVSVGLENVGAR